VLRQYSDQAAESISGAKFPSRTHIFFLLHVVRIDSGCHRFSSKREVPGTFTPTIKRTECEGKQSLPSSAKICTVWNFTATYTYNFMAWGFFVFTDEHNDQSNNQICNEHFLKYYTCKQNLFAFLYFRFHPIIALFLGISTICFEFLSTYFAIRITFLCPHKWNDEPQNRIQKLNFRTTSLMESVTGKTATLRFQTSAIWRNTDHYTDPSVSE
jgi:hypothetical protein